MYNVCTRASMFMFVGSPAVTGGLQVVETAPWTRKRTAPVGSHPGLCTGVGSPWTDLYQELWGGGEEKRVDTRALCTNRGQKTLTKK